MKFRWPLKPKELKPKFYVKETRHRLNELLKRLRKIHGQKHLIPRALEVGDLTPEGAEELQEYLDWANSPDMKV